jgi:hypothetical protein
VTAPGGARPGSAAVAGAVTALGGARPESAPVLGRIRQQRGCGDSAGAGAATGPETAPVRGSDGSARFRHGHGDGDGSGRVRLLARWRHCAVSAAEAERRAAGIGGGQTALAPSPGRAARNMLFRPKRPQPQVGISAGRRAPRAAPVQAAAIRAGQM